MRADQLARIDAAFDKGIWGILAGDYVTYVSSTGTTYPDILCLNYNLKIESRPGLIVDDAGLRDQVVTELMFSKKILDGLGILPLDVAGYWLIDGVRHDFAEKMEVLDKQNPVGGLHNFVVVRVRLASELTQNVPTSQWGYNL